MTFSTAKFSEICQTLAELDKTALMEFLALYNITPDTHKRIQQVAGESPATIAEEATKIMRLRDLMNKAPYGNQHG